MRLFSIGQLAPVAHPHLDLYLIGFTTACAVIAGLFFLRFWRDTRDILFLGFAVFFLMQAGSDAYMASLAHPNEGDVWAFLMRLISRLAVLAAIFWKNTAKG